MSDVSGHSIKARADQIAVIVPGKTAADLSGERGEIPVGHGFVDLHGRMIDLNCLIPTESGLVITDAEDINDRGQIVVQRYETSDPTTDLALLSVRPVRRRSDA